MEQEKLRYPFAVGKRVGKTKNNQYGWLNVNPEEISADKVGKPVIYVFNGSGTIEDAYANAGARFVKNLIGRDYAQIFSFKYGHFENDTFGDLTTNELQYIADCIFLPLLYNKNYEPYSKDEIKNHLGAVNFVSNCFGNTVVTKLMDILGDYLEEGIKCTPAEVVDITNNITYIAFAPEEVKTSTRYLGNRIAFKSLRDWAFQNETREQYNLVDENDKEIFLGAGKVFRDAPNRITVVSNSFVDYATEFDEHVMTSVELRKGLPFEHDQLALTIASCISSALGYALVDKVDMDVMQELLQNELDIENKTKYIAKQKEIFEQVQKEEENDLQITKTTSNIEEMQKV